jgi:hypothetical protein
MSIVIPKNELNEFSLPRVCVATGQPGPVTFQKVQFQKNLLAGLPITTTESTNMQGDIAKISNQIAGLTALYKSLEALGQTTPTPTPTPTR